MKQFHFSFNQNKQIIEMKDDNDHDIEVEMSEKTINLKNAGATIPEWNEYMRSYMQDILHSGNSVMFNRKVP